MTPAVMKGYVMGEGAELESSLCSVSNRKWFAGKIVNKRTYGTNYTISAKQIFNCKHPLGLDLLSNLLLSLA